MLRLWKSRGMAWPLWPLSKLFALLVRRRRNLYARGRKASTTLAAHVISVGNITVGGTGKTPTVIALANALKQQGHAVGIISRGYGRQSQQLQVVSNGLDIDATPEQAGDEPLLMARHCPGVPVVVCAHRAEAGRYAIENFGLTHIIADDAFQHLRLNRQADLVTIDATQPWGNGWMLPAGPLRDHPETLKHVSAVLITRADQSKDIAKLKANISRHTSAPVFTSRHAPDAWIDIKGQKTPLQAMKGTPSWMLSAIGNPGAFEKTVQQCSVTLLGKSCFKDHHPISRNDVFRVWEKARKAGAGMLASTEKDLVKMTFLETENLPVRALAIRLHIEEGTDRLINVLLSPAEMSRP